MRERPTPGRGIGRRSRLPNYHQAPIVVAGPDAPTYIECCRPEVIGARVVARRRIVDGFTWCVCCDRILTAGAVFYLVTIDGDRLDEVCPDCVGQW